MFYNYTLPFDSAGSVQYSKAIGVASTETASANERQNPVPLSLGTTSTQVPIFPTYIITKSGGGASPWSGDFSVDFGGTSGGLVVGKYLTTSSGMLESGFAFGFFSPKVTAPTTSAQSASYSYLYTASLPLFASLANVAFVYFPRLYHSIAATKNPQSARWRLDLSRAFGVGLGGHFGSLSLSINQINRIAGTQAAALVKQVGRFVRALSASSALILRGPGRIAKTLGHGMVAARLLQPIKLLMAGTSAAISGVRQIGVFRGVLATQTPRLSFGGNLFAKAVDALSGQSLTVARGIFVLRGTVTVGVIAVGRSISHLLTVAETSSAAVVRSIGWVRGVASSTAVLVIRSVGVVRGVVGASGAALIATAAHFISSLAVAQTSLTALFPLIGQATKFKVVGLAQTSVAGLSSLRAYLRTFTVASAEAVSVVRGTGVAMASVAMTSVAGSIRMVGYSLAVAAQSIVALALFGAHFVIARVASIIQTVLRVTRVALSGASMVTQASVARLGTERIAYLYPGVAMDAVASVVRLTGKIIGVMTSLLVDHIRGIVSLILRPAMQPQVARLSTPSRVLYLVTVQAQRSRVVSWFHLFVPDWAYQQTVLLPPGGGFAEPPAFGVIDPDDQTTFAFDWSARAAFNDPIVSASVTSSPPGMTFLGPVFTGGSLIEVTVLPFTPKQLPSVYRLRCSTTFASGRRSSFSIPVPVRRL